MQKRRFEQSGVVDADFEYTPRRSAAGRAETPLAMKTRSLASLMIGAAISLAALVAMVSLMVNNWSLYIHSMSLLLQLIIWALAIGIPGSAILFFLKLSYRGVRHVAHDFTGLTEARAEQKRLNALNAAEVARIHAEAQMINAQAMARMRAIDFDQYGNAAVIGVNPASIAQLRGQIASPRVAGELSAPTKTQQEEAAIPQAPAFREMSHLLTPERMVLCYTASGPAYGTTDDLLSMAVTGKPGRGKTTALMYYVVMLLQAGAEVWVWDPHGAMNDLAVLNGRSLPGMPATAKVVYLDRKPDIVASVPQLQTELARRDDYYRQTHKTKHPLLLLADELPVLADYDEQVEKEYKLINKQRAKDDPEEVPSLIYLIRRFVLEARKWRCFFIGSGQSIDAEILPTKVTDAMNSRIVFFNSDRKARMTGLETDAIKDLLPVIRRAGSGVMVFDCSRWDKPVIGAIPYIEVKDMLVYLGVSQTGNELGTIGTDFTRSFTPGFPQSPYGAQTVIDMPELPENRRDTGPLGDRSNIVLNALIESSGTGPVEGPELADDEQLMTDIQIAEFTRLYKKIGNIKECLRLIDGCNNRHHKHASWIVKQHNLRKEGK